MMEPLPEYPQDFTWHEVPVRKQRRWQLRKRAEGRCSRCGRVLDTESRWSCYRCLEFGRKYARQRKGYKGRKGRPQLRRNGNAV